MFRIKKMKKYTICLTKVPAGGKVFSLSSSLERQVKEKELKVKTDERLFMKRPKHFINVILKKEK